MGFSCTLLILLPETHEDTAHPVWTARDALRFGRVTRMEKLTDPRFGHRARTPHARAAICAVSILLGRMFDKPADGPRGSVAPPVLPLLFEDEEDFFARRGAYWQAIRAATGPTINLNEVPESRHIRRHWIPEHNGAALLDDAALAERLARHQPVLHAPFLWESCRALADALFEAEASGSEEWQEAGKDRVALALVRARRFYLHEIAGADARALFTFPD